MTAANLRLLLALPPLLLLLLLAAAAAAKVGGGDQYLVKNVVTTLYSRHSPSGGERLSVANATLLAQSSFNPLVPTKILVHGWLSGEKETRGGAILKDALLEVSDYNVILVDWSAVDSINYVGSRLLVSRLGELVAALVRQLVDEGGMEHSDLHLFGHSLGAHIMGHAGRTARLGSQGRITALDPAGPLFWNDPKVRLDKSDAGFVDVIHTCAGYLGYWDPIGHADFYPNGGTYVQPGCGLDAGACSHCRGYSLLLESIESPGAFLGTKCGNYSSFKAGKCKGNPTEQLGLGCDRRARGSFYFRTNKVPPYSTTSGQPASARLNSTKNFISC
ncbi:hypothetical protein ONE63_004754 [Megalurothrips usitatus]|uniref:Lipase domain-containing protein n=1 Tax=Megalurothrips usitatus TaxID=439358 RepID=A0AAV7X3V8_9NEOP|nr:hypothetical protein ONE63_004754 [Megalurothrips usitatus]